MRMCDVTASPLNTYDCEINSCACSIHTSSASRPSEDSSTCLQDPPSPARCGIHYYHDSLSNILHLYHKAHAYTFRLIEDWTGDLDGCIRNFYGLDVDVKDKLLDNTTTGITLGMARTRVNIKSLFLKGIEKENVR